MEDGRPFLDMAHIIANLNRMDAGIPDKVGWSAFSEDTVPQVMCLSVAWNGAL